MAVSVQVPAIFNITEWNLGPCRLGFACQVRRPKELVSLHGSDGDGVNLEAEVLAELLAAGWGFKGGQMFRT